MRRARKVYKKWRKELLDALFVLHPHVCVYCNKELNRTTATIDHKTAIAKEGLGAHLDNLQLTCFECNNDKGRLSHQEYSFRKFGKKVETC